MITIKEVTKKVKPMLLKTYNPSQGDTFFDPTTKIIVLIVDDCDAINIESGYRKPIKDFVGAYYPCDLDISVAIRGLR